MKVIAFLSLLALLFTGVLGLRGWMRRRLAHSLGDRVPLSDEEFAALFPEAGDTVRGVRDIIGRQMFGDMRLIRPDDRIAKDLKIGALDGLDADEIVLDLEKRFGICIPAADAGAVRSVRELVALVQSLRIGHDASQRSRGCG